MRRAKSLGISSSRYSVPEFSTQTVRLQIICLLADVSQFSQGKCGSKSVILASVAAQGPVYQPRLRFHRSITRPFFTRGRISDFDIFDRHADLVISKLKERFESGISVDIQDLLSRYTMDTATEFLFGQDVKSLSAELPYPSTHKGYTPSRDHPSYKFTSAIHRAEECVYPRGLFAKAWRLAEFWEDKVATQIEIAHQFIDPLIRTALRRKKDAKGVRDEGDDGTLLDHLVQQTEGTEGDLIQRLISY